MKVEEISGCPVSPKPLSNVVPEVKETSGFPVSPEPGVPIRGGESCLEYTVDVFYGCGLCPPEEIGRRLAWWPH